MKLDLNDWVDQHIFVTGDYEPATASLLCSLIRPGDTCIDAGANIGFFSLLMATHVGSSGSVWAFEPAPDTRARLSHNVALNGLTNVVVRPEALSNINGRQVFWAGSAGHSGVASLRQREAGGASYEVETARLTSCLPQAVVPALIKMDVEGAELLAVEGMVELLESSHPDLVLEVSDRFLRQQGGSGEMLCAMLLALGYRMYLILWDRLVAQARWSDDLPAQFNAFFTRRDALPHDLVVRAPRDQGAAG